MSITKAQRVALAPLLSLARRDGRQAREAGKPRTSCPHRLEGPRESDTASDVARYRVQRLREAWLNGWQAE